MKIKHLLMMAAAVAFVAVGCKKDEPKTDDTIEVNPSSLTFEAAGGSQTLSVVTAAEWTVQGASHFTLDKTSGKGNATVTVTAPAANAADVEETLTFKAGNKAVNVKLTQKGGSPAAGISVNPTSLDFPATEGGMKVVKVTASDKWTVSFDATWIKTTAKGGSAGEGKDVPFSCTDNTTGGERTAVVTFTCGESTATLTIKQAALKDPTEITCAQDFINEIILKHHNNVLASGDTTYNITADLDFTGIEIVYENPQEGQVLHNTGNTFYANINGNNHSIKNLRAYSWLIQRFSGIIKDLTFDESCYLELSNHSGGFLCEANYGGKIINVINKGTVNIKHARVANSSGIHFGAIMGINRAYVEGCKNYGNIAFETTYEGQVRLGGLIGTYAGTPDPDAIVEKRTDVIACENYGTITCTGSAVGNKAMYVGGVIGFVQSDQDGIISKSKNTGAVLFNGAGANYVGGFTGCYKWATTDNIISECENTGNVTVTDGDKGVGGMIGYLYKSPTDANFIWIEGGKVNCKVTGGTASEGAANPCANVGLVFGKTDAQSVANFVGTAEKPIQVAGSVVCGETTVTADGSNVAALSNGSANALDNITINVELLK